MSERDGHLPEDRQTERTRWELWAILIIVALVMVASLAWRSFGHHRAGPDLSSTKAPPGALQNAPGVLAPPPSTVGAQPHAP